MALGKLCAKLQDQSEKLGKELAESDRDREKVKEELDAVKAEIRKEKDRSATAEARCSALTTEVALLREEAEEARRRALALEQQLALSVGDREREREHLVDARRTVSELEKRLEECMLLADGPGLTLAAVDASPATGPIKRAISALSATVLSGAGTGTGAGAGEEIHQQAEGDWDVLNKQVGALNARIAEGEALIRSGKAREAELEAQLDSAKEAGAERLAKEKEKRRKVLKEKDETTVALTRAQADIKALTDRAEAREAGMRSDLTLLESKLSALEAESAGKDEELRRLSRKHARTEVEWGEERAALEARLSGANALGMERAGQVAALEVKVGEAEARCASLTLELEELAARGVETAGREGGARELLAAKDEQIAVLHGQIAGLEKLLERTSASMGALDAEHRATVERLEKRASVLLRDADSREADARSHQERAEAALAQLEAARAENSELIGKIAALNKDAEDMAEAARAQALADFEKREVAAEREQRDGNRVDASTGTTEDAGAEVAVEEHEGEQEQGEEEEKEEGGVRRLRSKLDRALEERDVFRREAERLRAMVSRRGSAASLASAPPPPPPSSSASGALVGKVGFDLKALDEEIAGVSLSLEAAEAASRATSQRILSGEAMSGSDPLTSSLKSEDDVAQLRARLAELRAMREAGFSSGRPERGMPTRGSARADALTEDDYIHAVDLAKMLGVPEAMSVGLVTARLDSERSDLKTLRFLHEGKDLAAVLQISKGLLRGCLAIVREVSTSDEGENNPGVQELCDLIRAVVELRMTANEATAARAARAAKRAPIDNLKEKFFKTAASSSGGGFLSSLVNRFSGSPSPSSSSAPQSPAFQAATAQALRPAGKLEQPRRTASFLVGKRAEEARAAAAAAAAAAGGGVSTPVPSPGLSAATPNTNGSDFSLDEDGDEDPLAFDDDDDDDDLDSDTDEQSLEVRKGAKSAIARAITRENF
jgi:hypothetical protein